RAGDPGAGVGRSLRGAGDGAEGVSAVPGADQGEGRADGPRGEGEPGALAERAGAASPAEPGRLRCAGPWLGPRDRRAASASHDHTDPSASLRTGDAWTEERAILRPIPARVLNRLVGDDALPTPPCSLPTVIDLEQRRRGEHVEVRDLAEYEVAL